MTPFLSIITINYNNREGLQKTLTSVLAQTYTNFEYIIIDGASTDGSLAIIEKNIPHLKYWVSEVDKGVFNAMNKGIHAAKGEYLLFLNSGDVLNGTTALSDFINHERFDGDIIYGDYKFEKGEKKYPDHVTPIYFMRTSLPHQSTLFKRKVFDEMGDYNENYSIVADRAFYIKCFLSGKFKFTHVPYALSEFDLMGLSHNPVHLEKKKAEDERMFKEEYGQFYADFKKQLALEQALSNKRKKTVKGILKRIVQKLKKLWKHRLW